MTETTFIYGLVDPRTGMLRYVGKADNPSKRWYDHLCSPKSEHTHKANWIKQLRADNCRPELIIIEEVPTAKWQESEQSWIRHFRSLGCDLTNGNDGGVGGVCPTKAVREKMSLSQRGKPRNPASIEKMRITKTGKPNPKLKGRWVDPAHLAAMVEAARSPKARERQCKAAKERANRPENITRMKIDNPATRPDVRAKLSIVARSRRGTFTGRKHSPESIEKMRQAALARKARK